MAKVAEQQSAQVRQELSPKECACTAQVGTVGGSAQRPRHRTPHFLPSGLLRHGPNAHLSQPPDPFQWPLPPGYSSHPWTLA